MLAASTEGAHSRVAREFIGSDSGSTSSRLVPLRSTPSTAAGDVNVKSVVHTEVRATDGAALWVVRGFSKLDDKPGFCVFSPEFRMAGTWWKMQLFPSGGGRTDSASSEGHVSLYLFATRAPAKAKYTLTLLKALPIPPPRPDASASDDPPHVSGTTSIGASSSSASAVASNSNATDGDRMASEAGALYVCHGSTKSFGSPSEGFFFLFPL
jgi:hypothetical protein